jgi:D-alanine-D-alanine ligase
LATLSLDVIFPILHGPYGEDGTLQGLLELADVPYVGAGVLASATGMDKAIMKILFAAAGLPLVRHDVVRRRDWREAPDTVVERLESRLRYPLFVKPANLGSSVGISRVEDMEALKAALDLAAEYDRKLVVEEGVAPCREIECAVIGNDRPDTSVLGEIVPSGPFYDYKAKYLDRSETIIPAQLTDAQAARIRTMAADAFKAIDGAGMARVDFLLASDTGDLFVNEINTHPGFTTISMFAKLWDATELPYPQLLNRLIELAAERHAEKQDTRTTVG